MVIKQYPILRIWPATLVMDDSGYVRWGPEGYCMASEDSFTAGIEFFTEALTRLRAYKARRLELEEKSKKR